MMNSFDPNIIPIIESFADHSYIKDMDAMRPDKLLDDVVVRNKIDDYKLTGDLKIRDELIFAFGNFVVAVAKQYQGNGLPICDLIGEGIIGLINAINGYDSSNPTKFITYAGVIISRQIREALDQSTLPVRVPKNIRNTMHKAKKKVMDYQLNGQEPEEVYDKFDEKEQVFIDTPFLYQKVRINTDNTDEELINGPTVKHIDLIQISDNNPEDETINFDLKSELHKVMKSKLTKIERKVLRLYFGLNRKYPMNSVKEIGRILHISGERARQLRDAAINKLRTSEVKNIFVDYI